MAHQDHLLVTISSPEKLDQLDRVIAIALQGHRCGQRRRIIKRIRPACAPLVILNNREEVVPRPLEGPGDWHLNGARTAMDEDQNRILAVSTAYIHDLSGSTQLRHECLLDAIGGNDL